MLILTRKPGETIRIGDNISISVLGVSGQQVRLGITAPEAVEVHREEIYQRIQAGVNQGGIRCIPDSQVQGQSSQAPAAEQDGATPAAPPPPRQHEERFQL